MRNEWIRWTLPPGISIAVHAVLIGIVAYIGMQISAQSPPRRTTPIAELALPAPPDLPTDTSDPKTKPTTPETDPSQRVTKESPKQPSSIELELARLGALNAAKPAMDPVALAALKSANAHIASPQSAAPPTVRFAGVQTKAARTIVYVVDGSGATANSFAYLQTQLLRSIDRLSPTQRFQVVLFRSFDGLTTSNAPINNARLARASIANKQIVNDWLTTIQTRGRSNPVDGLKAALALRPDLVLLITRSIERTEMGWAQGQRAILSELNTLNPLSPRTQQRPTVIKTIQLLDEDPTGIMRAIATFHGDGNSDYRVVTYDDLIAPDEPEESDAYSIGASNEQRIASAGDLFASLTASGTSFSIFYAYADRTERERGIQGARSIQRLVRPLIGADGRAAILDAQATLLTALAGPGSIPSDRLRSIVETLGAVMYSEPNTDAQRVLVVALARAQIGEYDTAKGAISELIELDDELGLDESTRAQAILAWISMGGAEDRFGQIDTQRPFVTENGAVDAVWGLILREAMTKARLREDKDHPWAPMIEIRNAARSNEPIANYIDTRIALILASTGAPPADTQLPIEVLLAAANTMSHSIAGRERAIELLSEIAQRTDEPGVAGDALWTLGVLGQAINTTDARARSASALTELAERFPEHPHAPDAIAGAIHATPEHDKAQLRDRLSYAVRRFPEHTEIDLWRLALAELFTDFARLDILDPITPNTREGVLAGQLYEQTVLGMLDRFDDPQIRQGLGLRMRDAAERFSIPGASMWTKRAAIDEIEVDPQTALASIDQLISDAKAKGEASEELELMRAQTLDRLGQSRTAFAALSSLSDRIDATGKHTSTYWQAWSLMLESIADHGTERDRADALRHITRLELIDQNLGGSPWRQRITAARKRLHSSP